MVSSSSAILTIVAIITMMLLVSSFSSAVSDQQMGWFPATGTTCRGTVGECMLQLEEEEEEEEFGVESESNRRILATIRKRYISYGALRRNSVPCSRRGASYYNCRRGAQKNPYTRGCSAITRCRR